MDPLACYRETIQSVLTRYYQHSVGQNHHFLSLEVSDRLAIDQQRDQYLWLRFGWQGKQLVQDIIVYICLKEGKVWVEQDATDLCIADALMAEGIPSQDLVLGFHPPHKRSLVELEIAGKQQA